MDQAEQAKLVPQTVIPTVEKKVYTGTAAKILNLLGTGCLPIEAARAVGCDPSYVSQLQGDEEFSKQVSELIEATMSRQAQIDQNYLEVESQLSKRLLDQSKMMFNPDQVLRTLKYVNEAKKKVPTVFTPNGVNGGTSGGNGPNVNVAVLVILEKMASRFILDPNSNVVGLEANGQTKTLETLPSKAITTLSEKRSNEKEPQKRIKNGPGKTDPYGDL